MANTKSLEECLLALRSLSDRDLCASPYDTISYFSFIEFIRSERLSRFPNKGGRVDMILVRACCIAKLFHGAETFIQGQRSTEKAILAISFANLKLLIQLSIDDSALPKTMFDINEFMLRLDIVLQRGLVEGTSEDLRSQLVLLFSNLVLFLAQLVAGCKDVKTQRHGTTPGITLQETSEHIRYLQEQLWAALVEVWQVHTRKSPAYSDEEAIVVSSLVQSWLQSGGPLASTDQPAPKGVHGRFSQYSPSWFHDELVRFMRSSKEEVLMLTAPDGHGKSVLACSMFERLQRALAKSLPWCTVFVAVESLAAPPTISRILESILVQLYQSRLGDMVILEALSKVQLTAGLYETDLWTALSKILNVTANGYNGTIIVLDGADEVGNGLEIGRLLMGGFARSIAQGSKVKVIATSSGGLEVPLTAHGFVREVTSKDTSGEIHDAVASALATSRPFKQIPPYDQEKVIASVAALANGSFVWSTLACFVLEKHDTNEELLRNIRDFEKEMPTIAYLVQQALGVISPGEHGFLIVSCLLAAARPLILSELNLLIGIDLVNTGSKREALGTVEVERAVRSLRPLLSIDGVHVKIQHRTLIEPLLYGQGHLRLSSRPHDDFFLRLLAYTKFETSVSLKPDSAFDNDQSRSLMNDSLLLYTAQYWIWTFEKTSYANLDHTNLPDAIKLFMPTDATLPIAEQLLWGPHQYRKAYYEKAAAIRKVTAKGSLAALHSTLNLGLCLERCEDKAAASTEYEDAFNISRTILTAMDPITIRCADRVIDLTDSLVGTVPNIASERQERVLITLIDDYKLSFGIESQEYVDARNRLAALYNRIGQVEKAETLVGKTNSDESVVVDTVPGSEELFHIPFETLPIKKDVHLQPCADGSHTFESETTSLALLDILKVGDAAQRHFNANPSTEDEPFYLRSLEHLVTLREQTTFSKWFDVSLELLSQYCRHLEFSNRKAEAATFLRMAMAEANRSQGDVAESAIVRLMNISRELSGANRGITGLVFYIQATQERQSMSTTVTKLANDLLLDILEQSQVTHSNCSQLRIILEWTLSHEHEPNVGEEAKLKLAEHLAEFYFKHQRYQEVIDILAMSFKRLLSDPSIEKSRIGPKYFPLVKTLGSAYLQADQAERAIEIYYGYFTAALTTPDEETLQQAQDLLLLVYDELGLARRAIAALQEVLVVRIRVNGRNHPLTMTTLHDLAVRCEKFPQAHSLCVPYYDQLLSTIVDTSEVSNPRYIRIADFLAGVYWMEQRYMEARGVYQLLWKHLLFKHTGSAVATLTAEFMIQFANRYEHCLKMTHASSETIEFFFYEYRVFCHEHMGESMGLTHNKPRLISRTEIHRRFAYVLRYVPVQSDISISIEQFLQHILEQVQKLCIADHLPSEGPLYLKYAREALKNGKGKQGLLSSMTALHVVAALEFQANNDQVALHDIEESLQSIVAQAEVEYDDAVLVADAIVLVLRTANKMDEHAATVIGTLRKQVLSGPIDSYINNSEIRNGSAGLLLLSALERLLGPGLISPGEILVHLNYEKVLWDNLRRVLVASAKLKDIIKEATPLRNVLLESCRSAEVAAVVDWISSFIERNFKLVLQEDSTRRSFVVALLDAAHDHVTGEFHKALTQSCKTMIDQLIRDHEYRRANDILSLQNFFFGESDSEETVHLLRSKIVDTVRMQLADLERLIASLAIRKDWLSLEALLEDMWEKRQGHQNWPAGTEFRLGWLLTNTYFLAGHPIRAVHQAEILSYNLQRVRGPTHGATLYAFGKLGELYTSTGHFYEKSANTDMSSAVLAKDYYRKALMLNHNVLGWLFQEEGGPDVYFRADDDIGPDEQRPPPAASDSLDWNYDLLTKVLMHLHLFGLAYQRFGYWPRGFEFHEPLLTKIYLWLGDRLTGMPKLDEWEELPSYGSGKADDTEGEFRFNGPWKILPLGPERRTEPVKPILPPIQPLSQIIPDLQPNTDRIELDPFPRPETEPDKPNQKQPLEGVLEFDRLPQQPQLGEEGANIPKADELVLEPLPSKHVDPPKPRYEEGILEFDPLPRQPKSDEGEKKRLAEGSLVLDPLPGKTAESSKPRYIKGVLEFDPLPRQPKEAAPKKRIFHDGLLLFDRLPRNGSEQRPSKQPQHTGTLEFDATSRQPKSATKEEKSQIRHAYFDLIPHPISNRANHKGAPYHDKVIGLIPRRPVTDCLP